MRKFPSDLGSLRYTEISPTAVLLTGAAVIASMIIGLTGPRLRDRHGSVQQEFPVGELGYLAEVQEAKQAFAVLRGGEPAGAPNDERVATLTREAFGRSFAVPDLTSMGFQAKDARIADLAPAVRTLSILYEGTGERRDQLLSLFAMPDIGRMVRFDGFGSAVPFAPGDEWISLGTQMRDGPRRALYATVDHDTVWMLVAPTARDVVAAAPLLANQGD